MGSKKPFFWVVLTILAEMILIALLVPSSFMSKINDMEYGWMQGIYSESSLEWLEERTDEWHYTLTRRTGLADGLRYMFFPTEEARAREKGMSRLGENVWFPYLESRGKALDEMLKTFLLRFGSVLIWMPLVVLMAIPTIFDGVMERKIKQHTFKYPSPFVYRYGVRASLIISFLLFACLISPLPVPPLLLPGALMLVVALTGLLVIGNLPKRI
jgi:hypothetical protein